MISIFHMFKVGIGPSSSHTIGPMVAGKRFLSIVEEQCKDAGGLRGVDKIEVDLYGSLSLTGIGHKTDDAIIMGLTGSSPDNVDIDAIPKIVANTKKNHKLHIPEYNHTVNFPNIRFNTSVLPAHENGMVFHAFKDDNLLLSKTFYSVGGGFVNTTSELPSKDHSSQNDDQTNKYPYPFKYADDILDLCNKHKISISQLTKANELINAPQEKITQHLNRIWEVMKEGIERGSTSDGTLEGPLNLVRRAAPLRQLLENNQNTSVDPLAIMDWVNMFALAVSEENAAGGRVVTSPTSGACGIIPAVLAYYDKFIHPVGDTELETFFMTAGTIAILYKTNASISGAEVGCQGEVGVSCSMAAAALAELMGANPQQVCVAAEIAMEHNLGLTCDPVNGQVQVPCIERNAINAVKAINSARMAIQRTDGASVSLDKVIATMYKTGKDMDDKYRETSKGGLASIVGC